MENKTFYENEQGWINPILGADSVTNKGTQIWQDDREYAQSLLYQITDESGKAIVSWTENLTDIYGNVTEIARNYKIGKYKVEAKHDWDRYYTDVSNTAEFEVVPVILNITKTANVTEVGNNTLVKFTIKVNNTSLINVTNVTVDPVNGKAPVVSADGKTITWTIDELSGPIEFNVTVRTSAIGNLTNNVTVNCNENKTLVKDNETVNVTDVILTVEKIVNVTGYVINGTEVTFTIKVNNTSSIKATNVTV